MCQPDPGRCSCPVCGVYRPCDAEGKPLTFYNDGIAGGFCAVYRDTGIGYNSHICYIDKQRCNADEVKFGGIEVQKG